MDISIASACLEPVKQPTKPNIEKMKELRVNKALAKDASEGLTYPFCFDVLSQLPNIPACITLYELL